MNQPLFTTANYKKHLAIALRAHEGQLTPHGLPYVYHVMSVATEVIAALPYEELTTEEADIAVACALLHDVMEDTEYDLYGEEIDSRIIEGVEALTKDDSLRRLQALPKYIQMVKIADRITNLDPPPPHWSDEKKDTYREEARTIHETLQSPTGYLNNVLEKRIKEYERY